MAAVRTWGFSQPAAERIRSLITAGRHATDAVEDAIAVGEWWSVMLPSWRASPAGSGQSQHYDGLDRNPHRLLVGDGAAAFAREQGFTIEPNDNMLSAPLKSPGRVGDSPLSGCGLYTEHMATIIHTALACLELDLPLTSIDSLSLPQESSSNEACHAVLDDIIRRTAPDSGVSLNILEPGELFFGNKYSASTFHSNRGHRKM
ncbi:unnamed protein product [Coregonus sp. 'balchen']|nr:unnamed protein product [Coregonus sp. 'balchen']